MIAEPERPSTSSYSENQDLVDPADMQMDLAIPAFQPYRGATGRAWLASSILDMMRQDIEDIPEDVPTSPERALTPTLGFSYDYATDAPLTIQRVEEAPMHSTPYSEPPTLSARPGPVLLPPRPRSTSVPPVSKTVTKTVQRMAKRYMPTTENITPPKSPARAVAMDTQTVPDTPPPVQRPERSQGRGTWRAPTSTTPGVGTRSKTRQAELEEMEATQSQAASAMWPEKPDRMLQIQRMTRDMRTSVRDQDTFRDRPLETFSDRPHDTFGEIQRTLPIHRVEENQNEARPPAAGIRTHQQDIHLIPPPRAGGGVAGVSTPVSTATLGLINRVDPLLAVQLREDPASLTVRATRLKLYAMMRLIRTGMLGQLAALQQWEEAMHVQDEK